MKFSPQTSKKVSGSFTGTGQSSSIELIGYFNLSLSGFGTGTVTIQRSFDSGASWKTVGSYTADTEYVGFEPEKGVLYRANCTAYTAGPIVYRISQ